jgi:hypothetical protein
MRKLVYYFLALVLIAAAATAIVAAVKSFKSHDDKASGSTSAVNKKTQAAKAACDIFTLADAKLLLGSAAKGGDNTQESSSPYLAVSDCTYAQEQASSAPVSSGQSATLLVRAPKTEKGVASNSNEFGALRPVGVQDVAGYGDNAYWDAAHGQLNILKNQNWYIVSYGPVSPAERTLDQTRQLADLLIGKM